MPLAAQAPPPPTQAPPPTQTATPKPTPTPAQTPGPKPASSGSSGSFDGASIDPRLAGVPIYAGAAFLQSFDLDKAQTVFVFGTNDPYANVVAFYKNKYRARKCRRRRRFSSSISDRSTAAR